LKQQPCKRADLGQCGALSLPAPGHGRAQGLSPGAARAAPRSKTCREAAGGGVAVTRSGLIAVLLWFVGLKAFPYEADDDVVPFVANSLTMSFFDRSGSPGYLKHMNKEGDAVPANRDWHERNGIDTFAYGHRRRWRRRWPDDYVNPCLPQAAAAGSFLVFVRYTPLSTHRVVCLLWWRPGRRHRRAWPDVAGPRATNRPPVG
jgi:hypothetical protein